MVATPTGHFKVKLAILLVSGLLSVLAAEVLVRVLGITMPSEYRVIDRVLYVQRPYARYHWTREGHSRGRYNRHGLRDRDTYAKTKLPGTYRILLFGDSHTEALQVDQNLNFDNRLEDTLNLRATQRVEVLNFALSGTGTGDQLLRLRKQGAEFLPDFVLLVFFVGNDFADNSIECSRDARRPYFLATADGVELDRNFSYGAGRRALTWLRETSALFNGLYKTSVSWLRGGGRTEQRATKAGEREMLTDRLVRALESPEYAREQLLLKQYRAPLRQCVEISFLLIEEFGRTVRELGANFGVLILPMGLQVQADMIDTTKIPLGDLDFDKPTKIVDEFLQRQNIASVEVLSSLRDLYVGSQRNTYGFDGALYGHLNDLGHEVVASRLEEFFCQTYVECRE